MKTESTNKSVKSDNSAVHVFYRFVAAGFGSGYIRHAPGTFGSIVGWISCLLVFLYGADTFLVHIGLAICFSCTGMLVCHRVLSKSNEKDPQWIVIDEWAGVAIALLPASAHTFYQPLCALLLFRFFDITKLGPIGTAEKLPGAFGVMLDDIIAGMCAALTLYLILLCFGL